MEITADIVKKLRDKTDAPILECKKALQVTNGDEEKAIDYLKKLGLKIAKKRSDKVTNQGMIESYIYADSKIGVMVELNCESDFVAKTDAFRNLAKDIAMQVAEDPLKSVQDKINGEIGKFGENISIKRVVRFQVGE